MKTSAWMVPGIAFILAAAMAWAAGPTRRSLALRSPAAESGTAPCHAYVATLPTPECRGFETGKPPDEDCISLLPQIAPGVVGEAREIRDRSDGGDVRNGRGGLAGARSTGSAPLTAALRKNLNLIDTACPNLPHTMQSSVVANLHIRIQIPEPLLNGDIASSSAFTTARAGRQNDLGLNQTGVETVVVAFTRWRTPNGRLIDSALTTIISSANGNQVRPSKAVAPQGIRFESEDLTDLAEADHQFRSFGFVFFDSQAFVLYLNAPNMNPTTNPDDDGTVRATSVAEVRSVNVVLKDTTETLGE